MLDGDETTLSELSKKLGMQFVAAAPAGYELAGIETVARTLREAVTGANVVVTDAWASMGQEEEAECSWRFDGYQVDANLLRLAYRTYCSARACFYTSSARSIVSTSRRRAAA